MRRERRWLALCVSSRVQVQICPPRCIAPFLPLAAPITLEPQNTRVVPPFALLGHRSVGLRATSRSRQTTLWYANTADGQQLLGIDRVPFGPRDECVRKGAMVLI